MLYQFSVTGTADDVDLITVPRDRGGPLDAFMSWVHRNCTRKDSEYIIFGFNLKYEFTQIFGNLPSDLNSLGEYEFSYPLYAGGVSLLATYTVRVMSDKRYGIVIANDATHRRVRVVDAAAFYPGESLDSLSRMLDVGRKVEVETKRFTRADMDNPLFLTYARQDAYLTRRIGEYIVDLHETYDVPTCITAPHFAARVFRRHFLHATIPLPDPELEQAGLYSYHGGKNGYYLPGPKHLANVYSFDITSAYPEAMRQLPDIEHSQWEWRDDGAYLPGLHGIVWIRARYTSCTYRGIMRHKNEWHESGLIEGWTTTYELDAALERGECEIEKTHGWYMVGEPGGPLVAYVDRFFEQKRTATGAARNAAKLFLNSLYGKFFQKVPLGIVGYYDAETLDELGQVRYVETDPDSDYDYQAGGLYHPPIASLITGYVRAKIHRLEHKYRAVMTSTDGFFAIDAPDPDDIGKDLGKLTVERGDLSIWRERLYDFKPHNPESKNKYALHGFRGSVKELRRIPLAWGSYVYDAQQVITNKLALKTFRGRRFRPGTFAVLSFTLTLSEDNSDARAGP